MQMKLNESHVSYIHSGMDEIEKEKPYYHFTKSIHLFKSRISITATEFQVNITFRLWFNSFR